MYLDFKQRINPLDLNVMQRILLTSDGSVTKLLEAYTGEPIQANKLVEEVITGPDRPAVLEVTGDTPVLRREVLLKSAINQRTLLYAQSFIALERLNEKMKESLSLSDTPIGLLLCENRIETFRCIVDSRKEEATSLAAFFNVGEDECMISRSYLIFVHGLPTIFITEKFPERQLMISES
ncbi:MAG: DUF98 domain-containing protein [Ktedonobacteraceae bacterium]|nr:DUF98 domain-containing protein [Ktedonobacteraceae bacterium]